MFHLGNKLKEKLAKYSKRKARVNNKIKSCSPDNRIVIARSNLYIKAEVVDLNGNVVASITDKAMSGKTKTDRAFAAGEALAKQIQDKKLSGLVFDRNGYLYHGRVKAFADGLRKGGVRL